MAKKITKPIDILSDNTLEFQWDNFIKNVVSGRYVLVIGSEIILSKDQNKDSHGDSTRLLFNSVKEQLIAHNHIGRDNNSTNFTELADDTPNIDVCIRNMVRDGLEFNVSEMTKELVELIRLKLFRVVMTTAIDPYLEVLMHEVWGDDLQVMDISADISSEAFDFEGYYRDDLSLMMPPTLYYIFGRSHSSSPFVATDNDAIEIMTKWMSKDAPHNFLTYVRSKRTLALGCKFDDWLFRFFWYILKGNINGLKHGEVAISLNDMSETDSKLKSYLKRQNIYFQPDARLFINQLIEHLHAYQVIENDIILSGRRIGGTFISYAHEDYDLVKTVFYRLKEKGIPVWFDEYNLIGGDDYEKRISTAISDCRVFIPVLSSQVSHDLHESRPRFYKDTEWALAQTHINAGKAIDVIPLRILGYNMRDVSLSSCLPDCISSKTVHDLEKQSLDELIFHIRNILIKQ